jgi:hypothetical protein
MMRVPKARHENAAAGRRRTLGQGKQGEQGKQAKLAFEMSDSEAQTKFLMAAEP